MQEMITIAEAAEIKGMKLTTVKARKNLKGGKMKIDLSKWSKTVYPVSGSYTSAVVRYDSESAVFEHYKDNENQTWILYIQVDSSRCVVGEGQTPEEARDEAVKKIKAEILSREAIEPKGKKRKVDHLKLDLKLALMEIGEW